MDSENIKGKALSSSVDGSDVKNQKQKKSQQSIGIKITSHGANDISKLPHTAWGLK